MEIFRAGETPVPRGPGRVVHRPRPDRWALHAGDPDRVQGAHCHFRAGRAHRGTPIRSARR